MTYAIIGSGNIGSAIARQFARWSTTVSVANARGPASIAWLAEELGAVVVPTELAEAIKADVVIFAVPFEAALELAKSLPDWAGRTIIDASNALNYGDFSPLDLGGTPSSSVIAEAASGARLVKAFNHDFARVMAREPHDGHGGHRVLFLSGNEPAANAEISDMMTAMGFQAVDLGRLDAGGLLQQFGGALTSRDLTSHVEDVTASK